MGVRLYNSQSGLFTSVDPVLGGNANRYTYPGDPINSFDLDGNRRCEGFEEVVLPCLGVGKGESGNACCYRGSCVVCYARHRLGHMSDRDRGSLHGAGAAAGRAWWALAQDMACELGRRRSNRSIVWYRTRSPGWLLFKGPMFLAGLAADRIGLWAALMSGSVARVVSAADAGRGGRVLGAAGRGQGVRARAVADRAGHPCLRGDRGGDLRPEAFGLFNIASVLGCGLGPLLTMAASPLGSR